MNRPTKLALIVLLGLSGCKGCDDKVDPCGNIPATSAEFNAVTYLDGFSLQTPCKPDGYPDITPRERRWTTMPYLYQNSTSIFAPIQKFDSVVWTVGFDPRRFKKDTLSIVFQDTGEVRVTLIGYRKPDLKCNPTDNGIDTVSKIFRIYKGLGKYLERFPGRYEGSEEGEPGRKRIIELQAFRDQSGDPSGIWIKNFPLTNDPFEENYGPPGLQFWASHNIYYFDHGNNLGTTAWIKIEDDGKIVIDYSQVKPPYSNRCDRFIKKFIGKKL